MKTRYITLILVFALIALIPLASAAVVERIEMTNCGFTTSSSVACGATARVTCNVNTTFIGNPAPEIVNVNFKVGDVIASGQLLSGTTRAGVWYADVDPETYAVDGQLTLTKVYAYDAEGNVGPNGCSYAPTKANDVYQAAECIVRTGSTITVPSSCTCSYDRQVSCSPLNVQSAVVTPSAGCADQTVQRTTGYCDYCQVDWRPVYSECMTGKEWNATDKFIGVATKTYVTDSQASEDCRQLAMSGAGDPADVNPPADDGALVMCRMDAWSASGKDAGNSNRHEMSTSIGLSSQREEFEYDVEIGTDAVGRVMRPLIFDVNQDGYQEAVFFTDDLTVRVVRVADETLVQEFQPLGSNVGLMGQPSLWNYAYSGAQQWAPELRNGTRGAGIAGIYYNTTDNDDYFFAVKFNEGLGVANIRSLKLSSISGIGVNPDALGSGVVCSDTTCFFVTNAMRLVMVDMGSGSDALSAVVYDPLSPATVYDTSMATTPVLVNVGNTSGLSPQSPMVVAWLGKSDAGELTWFACTVVGVCTMQELGTSGSLLSVSNVVVASTVKTGATSAKAQIFLTQEGQVNTTTTAAIRSIELVATGISAGSGLPTGLSFQNEQGQLLTGLSGGMADCVSEPTTVKCASGYTGVATLSKWVPTSATVVTNAQWTMAQRVSSGSTLVQAPLTNFADIVGYSPTSMAGVLCGTTRCYVVSGATSTAPIIFTGDYTIWSNLNDGPFAQIPTFGLINTISAEYSAHFNSSCVATMNAGDRIIGQGVYGDDLVLLVRVLERSSVNVADCTQLTRHLKLMRYSAGTGWSTVVDFGNKTVANGYYENVYADSEKQYAHIYLQCGEDGSKYCTWATGDGVTRPFGFIAVDMINNSVRLNHQMKGTFYGGNLNSTRLYDWGFNESGYVVVVAGKSAVIGYDPAAPNVPLTLDSDPSGARTFVGIAHKNGQWWWSGIPTNTYTASSVCTHLKTNDTVRNAAYFWNAPGMGDFGYPISYPGSVVSNTYAYCYSYIKRFPGTSPSPEVYADAYWSIPLPGYLQSAPVGPGTFFSFYSRPNAYMYTSSINYNSHVSLVESGFDSTGKYFVKYPYLVSSAGADVTESRSVVSVVSYRDGGSMKTYMPHATLITLPATLVANTNVGALRGSQVCVDPSGRQMVENVDSGSAGEYCFPTHIMKISGTNSLRYVQSSPITTSPRVIREWDSSTGKFTVDYTTASTTSSQATTDYNQLNCYAYSTAGNLVVDASKQIGSAYCTKQIASAELNGDGRDEIITPQGIYSVGGSSAAKVSLGGDMNTDISAMQIVDINGDTYADVFQVTEAGISGLLSTPSSVAYSSTGSKLSAQAVCDVRTERDIECERYGGSESECTTTTLYYVPQMRGARDPSSLTWRARVYSGGYPDAIGTADVVYSIAIDALLRFAGLNTFFGVAELAGYDIIGQLQGDGVLVQDMTYDVQNYGRYVLSANGNYHVLITARDEAFGESASVTAMCSAMNVTLPVLSTTTNQTVSMLGGGACTLGDGNGDGEFNYPEDIVTKRWVVTEDSAMTHDTLNGWLELRSPSTDYAFFASHGLSCVERQMTMEVKFRTASTKESIATFFMYGASVDNPSVQLPVSTFTVSSANGRTRITSYGSGNAPDEPQVVYEAALNTSKEFVVQVVADRVAKTVTTSIVNTSYSATNDFVNKVYGGYTGVSLRFSGASLGVDYMRTVSGGGAYNPKSTNQTAMENAFAVLNDCSTLIEKLNGSGYSPNDFGDLSTRAGHVSEYCRLLPSAAKDGGECMEYSQLANAVKYNSECYDEAYRYCVAVTYPSVERVKDGGQTIEIRSGGLDGATVCATELTITSGVDKIGKPAAKVIWRIVRDNWQYVLLLIGLIAIVSIAKSRVR